MYLRPGRKGPKKNLLEETLVDKGEKHAKLISQAPDQTSAHDMLLCKVYALQPENIQDPEIMSNFLRC